MKGAGIINIKNSITTNSNINFNTPDRFSLSFEFVVVTNETIYPLYEGYLEKKFDKNYNKIVIKDGEIFKNIETVTYILDELLKLNFSRNVTIVAFGGGVIGDIVGLVASLYKRGVSHIIVPTTLLSMVDASVGGKTGVNSKYGKNMIGTFKAPDEVYIDSYYLKTLPKREYNAGLAEIIKIAVMLDRDFFTYLCENDLYDGSVIITAIKRAVELKSEIVQKDYLEDGVRKVLNYGHTFGHIVELETNYGRYLHGEAVSIGINFANTIALLMGLITEEEKIDIENLLIKYSLPVSYKNINLTKFKNHLLNDKKSGYNSISYILPYGIGKYVIMDDVDYNILHKGVLKFNEY